LREAPIDFGQRRNLAHAQSIATPDITVDFSTRVWIVKHLEAEKIARQADTFEAPLNDIVRNPAFRRGFAEVRSGQHPSFDDDEAYLDGLAWVYEWGRQFAILAPPDLPLLLPKQRQPNPEAVELFETFVRSGEICR
jgi:hypothetical protein